MKNELAFAFFVSSSAIFFSTGVSSADLKVSGATESPQVSFAVEELKTVCSELAVDDSDISVLFEQNSSLEKQAYRIEVTKPRTFTISGGNPVGLMYGGLRLAESIQLSRNIERVRSESGSPYLAYRALKMNIPLDARTPSSRTPA